MRTLPAAAGLGVAAMLGLLTGVARAHPPDRPRLPTSAHARPAGTPPQPPRARVRSPQPRPAPTEALGGQEPEQEAGSAATPASEGDFLADNGLVSPACSGVSAAVSAPARCAWSGFAAAPAPTGDYAFDVHVDTGLNFINDAAAEFQDMLQTAWMLLVALVRGLIVTLEWCYSLNLVGGVVLARVTAALHAVEAAVTLPLLAGALAICGALAAYHGLIRRRVAQTLGQVLVTLAMVVGGMWAIVDPGGSVGALAGWVDEASVGALGVAAAGTPEHGARTLAASMRDLFSDTITAPFCFMEFGDVAWCMQQRRLDPRLRRAGLAIAAQQRALAYSPGLGAGQGQALLRSAALLEAGGSNGAIFLALPANGPARNAINSGASLLSVLCGGSSEATACEGATAAQAQFRTQQGTGARAVGLLLIWFGALGMLALVGWIALRLLAAAVVSLLCLLLAPVAVLAPALGDGGRALFAAWAMRLLGSLTAKLIYSLLLGAVLLVLHALVALTLLGWWVQWCVISALWWITFLHRREILGVMRVGEHTPWSSSDRQNGLLSRLQTIALYRATGAVAGRARRRAPERRIPPPGPPSPTPRSPDPPRPGPLTDGVPAPPQAGADPLTTAALQRESLAAQRRLGGGAESQTGISALRDQLQRVQAAGARSDADRDAHRDPRSPWPDAVQRRRLKLAWRAQRLQEQIGSGERQLAGDRDTVEAGQRTGVREGHMFTSAQATERGRYYDRQALLPAKGRGDGDGRRRDYARLASLAGHDERAFGNLRGNERLRAILQIDRALSERARASHAHGGQIGAPRAGAGDARLPEPDRRQVDLDRDRGRRSPTQGRGSTMPARRPSGAVGEWLQEERARAASGAPPLSLAQRAGEQLRRRGGDTGRPGGDAPPESPAARRRRQFGAGARGPHDS
jgi:hypothetical protein